MEEFTYEIRIPWDHTDCTTRIYFTAYLKWLDDALTELYRTKGMTYDEVGHLLLNGEKQAESFAIGEFSCRIQKPSKFDDLIRIRVTVVEIRERVLAFDGIFEDTETGEKLGHGRISFVCINEEGKSAPIPENIKDLF